MKSQAELVVFILLFVIGIIIFVSSVFWGRGVFQQNIDYYSVRSAEDFMRNLDDSISSVIKNGGSDALNYPLNGTIEIFNDNTIELRLETNVAIPDYWINVTSGSTSYIREIKDSNILRLQLIYPQTSYKVQFFTTGPRLSIPEKVRVELNDAISGQIPLIKIKVTFQ